MRGVSRTLACLNHHKEMLRESDIVSTAVDGMGGGRTDADREAQGSTVTATIFFLHQRLFFSCNKNKLPADLRKTIPIDDISMIPHLAKCSFVQRRILWHRILVFDITITRLLGMPVRPLMRDHDCRHNVVESG